MDENYNKVLEFLDKEKGLEVLKGHLEFSPLFIEIPRKLAEEFIRVVLENGGGREILEEELGKHVYLTVGEDDRLALVLRNKRRRGDAISNKDKKLKEQYYTPKLLAEFMVRSAIRQYKGELTKATFLEPACGEGALIEALIKEVSELTGESSEEIQLRIYAYDIDEYNVEVCRNKFPDINITCCDFILYEVNKTFDICVANPPWGSLKNKQKDFVQTAGFAHSKAFEKVISEDIKEAMKQDDAKKKNYLYRSCYEENFIRKCIPLCKAYCFLVQCSSVLVNRNTRKLREHLFKEGVLTESVVFENRKKIFDIASYITFAALSGGGEKKESNFIQGVTELSELTEVEALFKGKETPHFQKVTMDLEFIKGFSPEVGAIPYIKSQKEVEFLKELLKPREGLKLLKEIVETKQGTNGTNGSKSGDSIYKEHIEEKGFTPLKPLNYFNKSELSPMYKGAFFNHFDPLFLGAGKEEEFKELNKKMAIWENRIEQFAVRKRAGESSSTSHLISSIKIAWRDIARSSDQRTLVPALIPDEAWGDNTSYFFNAQNSLYLLPILSSLIIDNFVRYQVTAHATSVVIGSLTIDFSPTHALKEATNITLELSNLIPLEYAPPKWRELMQGVRVVDAKEERQKLQAKLDALIFIHYSRASDKLTPEDFDWLIKNRFDCLERQTKGVYRKVVIEELNKLWDNREELRKVT